jgi:hypothetical protein
MTQGFREFEFDLPDALLASLIDVFDKMESAPLLPEHVVDLPEEQGVYQLLHEGKVVYVGKTDGEAGLRQRLGRHAFTIQHRCNLEPSSVEFRALRVFVFTAIDLETQLIKHYVGKSKVKWNNSGFGSNDPGRERDTTKIKAGGFDDLFPIDLDKPVRLDGLEPPLTAAKALAALDREVPYIIRALRPRKKQHPDFSVEIDPLPELTTAREVIKSVVSKLPPGWQATMLPGRVILYREEKEYSAGPVIARSNT